MKFQAQAPDLAALLTQVAKHGNGAIKLAVHGGKLTATAKDDIGYAIGTIEVQNAQDGVVATGIPVITGLLKRLDGLVSVSIEGSKIRLKGENAGRYDLASLSPESVADPAKQVGVKAELDAVDLLQGLSEVSYAVGTDKVRPILLGINFAKVAGGLLLTATDGLRVAQSVVSTTSDVPEDFTATVEASALKRMALDGAITLTFGQMLDVEAGNFRFGAALVAGAYPDVNRLLNGTVASYTVTTDRATLRDVVNRLTLYGRDKAMAVTFDEGRIKLQMVVPEVGQADEALPATVAKGETTGDFGPGTAVGMSPAFLEEVLRALPGEIIHLGFSSNRKPIIIQREDGGRNHYLLPVILAA